MYLENFLSDSKSVNFYDKYKRYLEGFSGYLEDSFYNFRENIYWQLVTHWWTFKILLSPQESLLNSYSNVFASHYFYETRRTYI